MTEEYSDCNTCKHGYFLGFSSDGWHNLCGAGRCYLCHQNSGGECDDYENGEAPKDKEQI